MSTAPVGISDACGNGPRIAFTNDGPSVSPGSSLKRVLNAGSGPQAARQIRPLFRNELWQEIRLDIDPQAEPDVVGSITDMGPLLPQTFDAIWSSHSLEHLYAHEVPLG